MKYDAFISYRHGGVDQFVAETLHKKLEAFKLPKRLYDKLGREIDSLENDIKFLEEGFEDEEIYSDYFKCKELQEQIDEIDVKLQVKKDRWEELVEKYERLK